jgi:hypothetical protein
MAPILKSVSASLLRLHGYWSGKQHFDVIKVIVQINSITVYVAENLFMRYSGLKYTAFVYKRLCRL